MGGDEWSARTSWQSRGRRRFGRREHRWPIPCKQLQKPPPRNVAIGKWWYECTNPTYTSPVSLSPPLPAKCRPQPSVINHQKIKRGERKRRRERPTRTSRSSWAGESMSSGKRERLEADHLRVTEPVNMDQKASRRMAARAQNLYPPFPPNELPLSELCIFILLVVAGFPSISTLCFSCSYNLILNSKFPNPFALILIPLGRESEKQRDERECT